MKHTDLDIMARKIRKTTIEMAYHAGAAGVHVGGVIFMRRIAGCNVRKNFKYSSE